MLRFMPLVFLPRTNSCNVHFLPSHFRRKCSDVSIHNYEGITPNITIQKQKGSSHPLKVATSATSKGGQLHPGLWSRCQSLSLRLPMPSYGKVSGFKWKVRPTSWIVGGVSIGAFLSFSTSGRVYAEGSMGNNENDGYNSSSVSSSHGKKVYTDYSIIGIPGDGRCLFRSVTHGACIRSGKPLPDEALQRELADELRARVADEFVKRRAETEWMPITVYMHDEDSGGLIAIAEYGQEYGKDNPIRVLYHGFGHYDALHIHGKKGAKSRL